jgi:hypothetical protein
MMALPELHGLMPYLNGLVIVLPPVYAALEGIKFFGEWKHNITISGTIIAQLKTTKKRIMDCTDEQTLLAETAQLRYILEIENSDWATRYHQKVVEVPV